MTHLKAAALALCLLASPIAATAQWHTLTEDYTAIAVVSSTVGREAGLPRYHVVDMQLGANKMYAEMNRGAQPNKQHVTTSESYWVVDCAGLRAKYDDFRTREGLTSTWTREEGIDWESFPPEAIDEDPLLSYACRPKHSQARWATPEQAREAKWNQLVQRLRAVVGVKLPTFWGMEGVYDWESIFMERGL